MDELSANTPRLSWVKLAMIHAAEQDKDRKLVTLDIKNALVDWTITGNYLYGIAQFRS